MTSLLAMMVEGMAIPADDLEEYENDNFQKISPILHALDMPLENEKLDGEVNNVD